MNTKICSKCGEDKPLDRYQKASWIKSGYLAHCKDCDNKRKRESEARIKATDPEAWSERHRAYVRKYKSTHPDRVRQNERRQNLQYKFGITVEQYEEMLAAQNGACICGRMPTTKRLAVDHDRTCCPGNKSCGECVRGLLCANCNTALGLLNESIDRIQNLLNYMEKYK